MTYAEIPWDVLLESAGSPTGGRQLTAQPGAALTLIGQQNVDQFDAITIETLRGYTLQRQHYRPPRRLQLTCRKASALP